MKVKCVENHCSNIAEAVDVVERYEALYEDCKDSRRGATGIHAVEMTNVKTGSSTLEDDVKQIMKELQRLQQRQDQKEHQASARTYRQQSGPCWQGRPDDRVCFRCGEQGHFISTCPNRSTTRPTTHNNNNAAPSRQGGNYNPSN